MQHLLDTMKERLHQQKISFLSGGASSADIIILDKFNYKVISEYDYVYFVGGDIAPLAELVNEIDIRY